MISNAVFLGSKKFGLQLFKSLFYADRSVNWTILCQPDLNDTRTFFYEFQKFAIENDIDFLVATSSQMVTQYLLDHSPDVVIVCGYYRILPIELIANVPSGVWGIHNSLLPRYRGGSPLVWQLINGERTIGSSFFKLTEGMDDGAILAQVKVSNSSDLTISEATEKIEEEWTRRLPLLWADFCHGTINPSEQIHSEATYCAQRQEADGLINWSMNASDIDAFIRAQGAPYPRAFFELNGKKVKVVRHRIDPRTIYGVPGQVFQVFGDYVTVCCSGRTAITLCEVEVGGVNFKASDVINSIKMRLASCVCGKCAM